MGVQEHGSRCGTPHPDPPPQGGREKQKSFPRIRARLAVAHQAVEMHADVSGFRRRIGQRDGAIECDPRLVIAAELHQERTLHAEKMTYDSEDI